MVILSGDTIVAQSSGHGRTALSIIRLSGARAHELGRVVATRWPRRPREAILTALRDQHGSLLDRAVVMYYDAPSSFTGEDIVELITHGGLVVPVTVLDAFVAQGARMALPGEFTRRAVLNGKLDLLQAEATGDLIAATSRLSQRAALHQLDGGLSRRLLQLRADILAIEALLAYDIDFPEEDQGPLASGDVLTAADTAMRGLNALLATAKNGELAREGALVVIAGLPNVGKSSLFNALIGKTRALVTELPGTTRDAIEAVLDNDGWPLRLVDTAGLRATDDPIERLGIEIGERYLEEASVVLVCGDTRAALEAAADAVHTHRRGAQVLVGTKADLHDPLSVPGALTGLGEIVAVSAETGAGLTNLIERIQMVLPEMTAATDVDAPLLTRTRHRYGIALAVEEIEAFRSAWWEQGIPATVAATHLRAATGALEEIIGTVDVEEILDEVFSRFCVGK